MAILPMSAGFGGDGEDAPALTWALPFPLLFFEGIVVATFGLPWKQGSKKIVAAVTVVVLAEATAATEISWLEEYVWKMFREWERMGGLEEGEVRDTSLRLSVCKRRRGYTYRKRDRQ